MPSVCFYFQVHQPLRVKKYRIFDIGRDNDYFNDQTATNLNNERIIKKVAAKCYLPANQLISELLERHPEFCASFSFSGLLLEQLERYSPETLKSFQRLIDTGRVEVLGETYYHSLAFFYSRTEFERQVDQHARLVKRLFNVRPRVFRNTELAYRNDLGDWAAMRGYHAVLAEGWDRVLGWRSPNFVYHPPGARGLKLLLKNYRLSDDLAFRFSEKTWSGWPLLADRYANWISAHNGNGQLINLFMDYETFGEHQWADTGIFDFLRALPAEVLRHPDNNFMTVSQAAANYEAVGELDVQHTVTWADTERDLSAWMGNDMQTAALAAIYGLEGEVARSDDQRLRDDWCRLQTSDHFYYMCTKWFADGDVHAYFNPYSSPYDAFISFMNAVTDLKLRISSLGRVKTSGKIKA